VVRFLPFLISLVLSVYALFSCIQTRDEDVPYLPKLVWIILIVFVPFVGPITWLLMSRSQGVRREQPVQRAKPTGRPVAPDDDPDFLASLDRYRDPRTTVRPPNPDDVTPPVDKPQDTVGGETADDKPSKAKPKDDKPSKAKSKDDKAPKAKSGDKAEEAPTEPDDGKA
jgi:hypothetical protein